MGSAMDTLYGLKDHVSRRAVWTTIMDLGNWLRSLGLERYKAAFHENEITEKVLPNLTAEDLKELGVAALGHRRTLLDAIAALRNDASGKATPVDEATTLHAPSARPE